jgi:hypothetical protein
VGAAIGFVGGDGQGRTVSPVDPLPTAFGLGVPEHDHIALAYTDGNLTGVTYRSGGPSGTVVATLTLGYTDGNLTSVARS